MLYKQAVGVLGIAPQFFYEMTPYEVSLAYEGYIDKMETFGNIMLMAIRQQNAKKAKPIKLRKTEGKSDATVKQSTLSAREATFAALGIK